MRYSIELRVVRRMLEELRYSIELRVVRSLLEELRGIRLSWSCKENVRRNDKVFD